MDSQSAENVGDSPESGKQDNPVERGLIEPIPIDRHPLWDILRPAPPLLTDGLDKLVEEIEKTRKSKSSKERLLEIREAVKNYENKTRKPEDEQPISKTIPLAERLKGKEGRTRTNLLGKRAEFSARTVINPDTTMSIRELGVPIQIFDSLTIRDMENAGLRNPRFDSALQHFQNATIVGQSENPNSHSSSIFVGRRNDEHHANFEAEHIDVNVSNTSNSPYSVSFSRDGNMMQRQTLHTQMPTYSFDLHPENHQPTGRMNFSHIDNYSMGFGKTNTFPSTAQKLYKPISDFPLNEFCPICLDGFMPDDECVITTCSHIYHKNCLDSWICAGNITCPTCRWKMGVAKN